MVVPSNRPDRLEQFMAGWEPLFRAHMVETIVVRDSPEGWKEIPEWIPRRTDMIRSWGFYLAWRSGADLMLSLDDDVLPATDLFKNYLAGFSSSWPVTPYLSVGSLSRTGLEMRGFPYGSRGSRVLVQVGSWDGSPDVDAATHLVAGPGEAAFAAAAVPVPRGCATTVCAMNVAFRREAAPLMWQLPLLEGRYNRWGDIWAGLFAKKVLDHQGDAMVLNTVARVRHDRASDPYVNVVKEAPGLGPNEGIWAALEPGDYRTVTDSAARYFAGFDPEYAGHFQRCRDEWLALYGL